MLDLFSRWERGQLLALAEPRIPDEYTRAFQARQLDQVLTEVLQAQCAGAEGA
jgi:hypothetical protein